jgi:hypothetical protein
MFTIAFILAVEDRSSSLYFDTGALAVDKLTAHESEAKLGPKPISR